MEPARFQYDLSNCGISRALAVLGEKWTLLITREAFYGVRRFDDFVRALGCGRGVLSDRLKTLIEDGIMERMSYRDGEQRAREEYSLTEKGRDLYAVLLALSQWSDRWSPSPDGPAAIVTDKASGRPVEVVMTSNPEVQRLHLSDLTIAPGPGAKRLSAK